MYRNPSQTEVMDFLGLVSPSSSFSRTGYSAWIVVLRNSTRTEAKTHDMSSAFTSVGASLAAIICLEADHRARCLNIFDHVIRIQCDVPVSYVVSTCCVQVTTFHLDLVGFTQPRGRRSISYSYISCILNFRLLAFCTLRPSIGPRGMQSQRPPGATR